MSDLKVMKLLSIDVGIKNLAFCIFEVTGKNYKILSWDVINLCGKPPICNQQLKKGGQCKRNAKYKKLNILCCKSCAKKNDYIIPSEHLIKILNKRTKISDLKTTAESYNLNVTQKSSKQEIIDLLTSFTQQNCLEVIPTATASNITLVEVGIAIRECFDSDLFLSVDTVIIENQISPIANRMKTVQGMIAQFFIMRNIEDIQFVSAANKLKQFIGQKKTTYKERKSLGIETTRSIINQTPEHNTWYEHFSKHGKQDDLADSFLQGLWYINQCK